MAKGLKDYFPLIREREEVLAEIEKKENLRHLFRGWTKGQQEEFLSWCTGAKGVKILYDSFFKEIMNPEYAPARLEELLSLLLGKGVRILHVLPNDNTRLADEQSLLIMDMVVELADGSIANVEVQKIGYHFPGQRSACYSADLLLRQYKRVRDERKQEFSYREIKPVYTVVLFEKSPTEFRKFPDCYRHLFRQQSDTGLELNLLQEFCFIPLDIFKKAYHNEGIKNRLDAWLVFLSMDEPEAIVDLLEMYPDFEALYREVYAMCQNLEEVMRMFSEELREMDRNTVQYMIDEMQEELDRKLDQLTQKDEQLQEKRKKLGEMDEQLREKDVQLQEKGNQLREKDVQLQEKDVQLQEKGNQLREKDVQLQERDAQLARQQAILDARQLENEALQRRILELEKELSSR
ncbi:MAG TPA: PD-(D/E)XK nuclease family transposase [Candidatus Egerieimonas intestinavium]|uniref:PD-(D/E)XK nuclease family transposase n=1 Tax=Candidatus Egerieimonas intestinavium TaxID=2840777 RepID=A0A9D1EL81_9FIRM|nr:PD-(D/E)XK nuclease family transposase [Candidatus Egerieimonas intestinavium]